MGRIDEVTDTLQWFEPLEEDMVSRDKYGAIVELAAQGVSRKAIARALAIDPKTVRKYLREGEWKPYARRSAGPGLLAAHEDWIRARAPEVDYSAQVMFQELQAKGYAGSYQTVRRFVQPLRQRHEADALATIRFETEPGQQAQVDWGSSWVWLGEERRRIRFFAMTLGYSRRLFARAYESEKLPCLIAGHEAAFAWFGGCTRELLYDNPKTMVIGREEDGRRVILNAVFQDFADHYGIRPRFCQPYRARTKGKVESAVKYVKRNFLAGRRFVDLEHLNRELERWIVEVADVRLHGTTQERPIDRFPAESLRPVTCVPPYRLETIATRKVPLDFRVSYQTNRYSVPWRYVGRTVEIWRQGEGIRIVCDGLTIARHPRLTGRHQQSVDPAHEEGLFRIHDKAAATTPPRHDPRWQEPDVAVRDLSIYDAVAGL